MLTRRRAAELLKKRVKSYIERGVSNDKCPISQENLTDCKRLFIFETSNQVRYGYDMEAIRKYLIISKRPVDPLSREFYKMEDLKRIDKDHNGDSVFEIISSDRALGLEKLDEIFERIYENAEEKLQERIAEWECIQKLNSIGIARFLTVNVSGFLLVHLAQMIQANAEKSMVFLGNLIKKAEGDWKLIDPGIRDVVVTLSRNLSDGIRRNPDLPKKGSDWLNYETKWYKLFFKTKYIDPNDIDEILEELLDDQRYIEFILRLQDDLTTLSAPGSSSSPSRLR